MSMVPFHKGILGVPDSFEMIESGTWRLIGQDQDRCIIGVGNIRANIFTVVADQASGTSYIGNFLFLGSRPQDQIAFAEMMDSISESDHTEQMSAFVGGGALTKRETPLFQSVNEKIINDRDFVVASLSLALPERPIFDSWSDVDETIVFAGISPNGKFTIVGNPEVSD